MGLLIFYVALVETGIATGRLVQHGWDYRAAKASLGNAYKIPVGMGAGIMGVGYWCFAANVALTIFQARLVRVPKPTGHLWKFFLTGAAALTVGTVQGVIQVQPGNADWLYRAGHAGQWIDPISHAHINLVTGLTMLVLGALFQLAPRLGGVAPSRRQANTCFYVLLAGSLAFYGSALFIGLHEGHMVVSQGLTPEQAEEATAVHPFLIMGSGIAMLTGFWLALYTVVRCFLRTQTRVRPFVLAGCAALALGTLQGPVQAFPAVHELLDRSGAAGDIIVNLHAQLNMLGGLMVILIGLALPLLRDLTRSPWPARQARIAAVAVPAGMLVYYAAGIGFSSAEASSIAGGHSFHHALVGTEPAQALVLLPAALAVLIGFSAFARAAWDMTAAYRVEARRRLRIGPATYTGRIPRRVRRLSPRALAAYEIPMGLLGFPGVGWLFAGFPIAAIVLLTVGPALAWAAIPLAFSPFGQGPLRHIEWRVEFVWLPVSALLSAAMLYRAHVRRLVRVGDRPPRARRNGGPPDAGHNGSGPHARSNGRRPQVRGGRRDPRARVVFALGAIALVLVSLPLVPAVTGLGRGSVRYSYEHRLTREITGQFLDTPRGHVKLFAWSDPQNPYPPDALRIHASQIADLLVRAAAVDRTGAYQLFDVDHGTQVALSVRGQSHTSLALVPRRPPPPGRYLFAATHEGMFGGRDFAYLSVVPPGAPVTPINDGARTAAAVVAQALLPIVAALAAALFSLMLVRSFRRRPAGQKLLWAAGFALFGVAAASEALAQRSGWSPGLFRVYYLTGGLLTVAYLGAGSAWLHLRPRVRDAMVGALALATVAAALTVLLSPIDAATLATTPSGRPPANGAIGGHAFVWAIALNSFGTLFLIGGALYSVARRRRVRANAWIGGGALVLALATSMSRAGVYSLVYTGELVGLAFMFYGFTLGDIRPRAKPLAGPGRPPAPVLTPATGGPGPGT